MSTEPTSFSPLSTNIPFGAHSPEMMPLQLDVSIQKEDATATSAEKHRATQSAREPLPAALLPAEVKFYGEYLWCLNPFPTMQELVSHLALELKKFDSALEEW